MLINKLTIERNGVKVSIESEKPIDPEKIIAAMEDKPKITPMPPCGHPNPAGMRINFEMADYDERVEIMDAFSQEIRRERDRVFHELDTKIAYMESLLAELISRQKQC